MWSLGIPLLSLVLLMTLVGTYQAGGQDDLQAQTDTELVMYRSFVSVADMYFKQNPSPPSTTTVYGWADIKAAAPPGMTTAAMNPSWKVVRASDGTWAACTELKDVAVASVGGLFPAPTDGGMTTQTVGLQGAQIGVGVGSNSVATAAANLCK